MPVVHVYFIGAGPGAPDLLTLRGRDILARADLVIYADSLVHPALCEFARAGAEIIGSSSLTLEEIVERTIAAAAAGQTVARLQSGDPAIYGAIHEQMVRLAVAGVPWTIVPGVSSAFAAAALLGVELTVPEVTQTIIMSRVSGRASPVPPLEELKGLAAHQASLVLFLSVTHMSKVVAGLRGGGYPDDTPVAVVYRVTWEDEQVVRGTLADIVARVREAKFIKQALILVSPALRDRQSLADRRSRLYSATHSHLFRQAAGAPQD